jgi:predicted Zn-ribbon and HTH transcriptional regulator
MLELNTIGAKRRKVAEERMSICQECPELEPELARCKMCGCFMKGKTLFMSSKCPLGKWDKHEEVKNDL